MATTETPTNTQITVLMSRLLSNWTELMSNYYDIFINPNPMEITLELVDEDGNTETITLPNRAMDREYILNGSGNPNGQVPADLGALYQDLLNGIVYIKIANSGENDGWSNIITKSQFDEYIQRGIGIPEGVVTAPKGTLYVDISTGSLFTKQSSAGNTGWFNIEPQYSFVGDLVENLGVVDISESFKQTVAGKQDKEVEIIELTQTSGNINLTDSNGVYKIAPTGNITFLLPVITDTTHYYQMLIQLYIENDIIITLGTDKFFAESEPDIGTGYYNIIYEYDSLMNNWICGAIKKG